VTDEKLVICSYFVNEMLLCNKN